jgi:hypothetical protein
LCIEHRSNIDYDEERFDRIVNLCDENLYVNDRGEIKNEPPLRTIIYFEVHRWLSASSMLPDVFTLGRANPRSTMPILVYL